MSQELRDAVEALLFASAEPLSLKKMAQVLELDGPSGLREALDELESRYASGGVQLVNVAGGWQLRTHPRHADVVARLLGGRPRKLSRAALEVLSIVAYRQPVTKPEVDELRGVDSGGVIRGLLEKSLLRNRGRATEIPGRPLQYGTTSTFLELFSLESLADLPTLTDRDELDDSEGSE